LKYRSRGAASAAPLLAQYRGDEQPAPKRCSAFSVKSWAGHRPGVRDLRAVLWRKIAVRHRFVGAHIPVKSLPRVATVRDPGVPENSLNVLLGLRIRRDPAVGIDNSLTGIVGCDGERHAPVISIEQVSEMANAAPEVLLWLEAIEHAEGPGSHWHELHEACSPLRGHRRPLECRLRSDDGFDQSRIHTVLARDFSDLNSIGSQRAMGHPQPSRGRAGGRGKARIAGVHRNIREINDPVSVSEPRGFCRGRRNERWRGHRDDGGQESQKDRSEKTNQDHAAKTISKAHPLDKSHGLCVDNASRYARGHSILIGG